MDSKIVLCCDGTWCGDSEGTTTNVKILADIIADKVVENGVHHSRADGYVTVCYFDGTGIEGSFTDYLVNGAIAEDIKTKCIEGYKFIVDHFEHDKQVWMFGLSRGAYTVRCIAGMINNIGIIKNINSNVDDLCEFAYYMYRSKDPQYAPGGNYADEFKVAYSHSYNYPPIKFMGLMDTVGSLGIPKIDSGVSLSYEFYDQNVSNEVDCVFQALATHDRLSVFEPCFARRKEGSPTTTPVEVWFPGAHYDIGRQRFVPFRKGQSVEGIIRLIQEKTNIAGLNIDFTEEYSRNVFDWMFTCIESVDSRLIDGSSITYDDYVSPPPVSLRKNAYDELYNRVKWIPFVDSLFGKQVLRDRHVPLYIPSTFYGDGHRPDPLRFRSATSGNKSRTFDVREAIRINPIQWA